MYFQVTKTYWCLTKGVPNPEEGIIDIPMVEDEVHGRYRMGLRPNRDENTRLLMPTAKKIEKFEAVTKYKVSFGLTDSRGYLLTPSRKRMRIHYSIIESN